MNWRDYFAPAILMRARQYQEIGLVQDVQNHGNRYTAMVIGTKPYHVSVEVTNNQKLKMSCDCPHARDGHKCKHMAALCMELDEMLDGDYLLPAPKGKKTDERVHPFSVKNTPDSDVYTFFDLSEITKECKIMQSEVDAAQKLIDDGSMELSSVQVGYYSNQMGGYEPTGRMIATCLERGIKNQISICFSHDALISTNCGMMSCYSRYDSRYSYSQPKLCKHQLAALFLLEDHIDKYNPGDMTDGLAHHILSSYLLKQQNQMMGAVMEQVADFHFEPKLDDYGDFLELSFRVGTTKLYVAKNLTELVSDIENKDLHVFGKNCEIDFNEHMVAEDSQGYFDFVQKIVKGEMQKEELNRSMYSSYSRYYEDNRIKGNIVLYGDRIDEVYELIYQTSCQVTYQDKAHGGRKQTVYLKEQNPKLVLNIIGNYDNNNVLMGIRVYGDMPDIIKGDKYYYYIEDNQFNRMSAEATEKLAPLFQMNFPMKSY